MVLRSSDSRVDRLGRILLGRARGRLWFAGGCRLLYWIWTAARGEGVCLAQAGGAEKEEGGEVVVAGDRDRSWAALCRDEGTHRGTLVRWRSLEEVAGVSAAMRSSATLTTLTPGQSVIWQQAVKQAIQSRRLAHVPS